MRTWSYTRIQSFDKFSSRKSDLGTMYDEFLIILVKYTLYTVHA